jgi:hypothetical protein
MGLPIVLYIIMYPFYFNIRIIGVIRLVKIAVRYLTRSL